jgi:two-component system CheB/CheR fusion protein
MLERVPLIVHIVDPDQAIADGLRTLLHTYGMQVVYYPDAESFLDARPDVHAGLHCLLVEADLPDLSGPALLQKIRDDLDDLPVLLFVSTLSPDLIAAAQNSRQIRVIEKPFVNSTLIDTLLRLQQRA